jgi:excisionase family DNA binding protein
MHSNPRTTPAPDGPQLVDRLAAAQMLGVSANTISNLIARHELQSLKIGSRRLIDTADLRAFIAARKGVQS